MPSKVATFYEPNPPTGFIAGLDAEALSEIPSRCVHAQFPCKSSRLAPLESMRITLCYKHCQILFCFSLKLIGTYQYIVSSLCLVSPMNELWNAHLAMQCLFQRICSQAFDERGDKKVFLIINQDFATK